jgi:hypothetical protein
LGVNTVKSVFVRGKNLIFGKLVREISRSDRNVGKKAGPWLILPPSSL